MGLLFALIIGAVVGFIVGGLFQRSYEVASLNMVFGVVGAVIGLGLYAFTMNSSDYLLFSWSASLMEACGAAIAVTLFSLLQRAAPESGSIRGDENADN